MRIEILGSAEKDLIDGFNFYERQSKGLGDYFLDSLFSDIESLYIYAVFMPSISGINVCFPKDSTSPFTIGYRRTSCGSMLFWIVAGILRGFATDLRSRRSFRQIPEKPGHDPQAFPDNGGQKMFVGRVLATAAIGMGHPDGRQA